MALRIDRIVKLRKFLEKADAKSLNQDMWCETNHNRTYTLNELKTKPNECGTQGCIAGWAVLLFGPKSWKVNLAGQLINSMKKTLDFKEEAMSLLGITTITDRVKYESTPLFEGNGTFHHTDRRVMISRLKNIESKGVKSKWLPESMRKEVA